MPQQTTLFALIFNYNKKNCSKLSLVIRKNSMHNKKRNVDLNSRGFATRKKKRWEEISTFFCCSVIDYYFSQYCILKFITYDMWFFVSLVDKWNKILLEKNIVIFVNFYLFLQFHQGWLVKKRAIADICRQKTVDYVPERCHPLLPVIRWPTILQKITVMVFGTSRKQPFYKQIVPWLCLHHHLNDVIY